MRMQRLLQACLGIVLAASVSLAGTPSYFVPVGARPIALGGAFVGIADDAYGVYWNPAGLPRLQRQEFLGGYAPNQYVSGLSAGHGALTVPLGEQQAIGVDMFYTGFSDDELDFVDLDVRASYSVSLGRSFSLGVTGKFVSPVNVKEYGTDRSGTAQGFGFDVGAIYDFGSRIRSLDGLRLGLVVRDIGGTSVNFDDTGQSGEVYPQEWSVGASYRVGERLLLATQLDDRIHLGAEYSPFRMIALRAGMQRDVRGYGEDLVFSGGLGLKWRGIQFAYAYEHHPVLSPTHHVGLSFAYNPSFITIRGAEVQLSPIYRALYRSYEATPDFAEVTLKNTSPDPVAVNVGITVPTMMEEGQYHTQQFVMPAQATETVLLTITVDDSVLMRETSSYDNLVQPEVYVTYQQEREEKRATRQLESIYVVGRNKMTWENPLRISAFITPEHRAVVDFGNRTINEFRQVRDEVFDRCRNLGTAMMIFDAVGKYGINYNPDQTTPYYKLVSDTTNMRTIFDTINYPIDTFRSKLGDCDDVTVLYTSLLEQQNIPTALLDVFDPVWGHVYMMFDTGLTPEEALRTGLFLDETEFVEWTDPSSDDARPHAWIPVETTMFGQTFVDAWKAGVGEYHEKAARNYIRMWSVTEGRQRYTAGAVDAFDVPYPDVDEIRSLVNLDLTQFHQRLELPPLEEPITAEKLYVRGTELIARAQYSRAIDVFNRAIEMEPGFVDAYNGRGYAHNFEGGRVRYLPDNPAARRQEAEGHWQAAVSDFRYAIDTAPGEPGYWVNLMITYQLLNDTEQARAARERALELDEGLRPILQDVADQ